MHHYSVEKNVQIIAALLKAYLDKCVGERSELSDYYSMKERIIYLIYRYTPYMEKIIRKRQDIYW